MVGEITMYGLCMVYIIILILYNLAVRVINNEK